MNPLMKENQILHMISDASSMKKNNGQSLYWIEFHCKNGKHILMPIPNKQESYKEMGYSMEEVRDKSLELMFDLSMHHYISNVRRDRQTLKIMFKECRGGRKPNFGIRTLKKIDKIIRRGSIQEYPF